MEKINGVTMDGHTVVDIDRNADEVVIPEYAKDTTYVINRDAFFFLKTWQF